MSDNYGDPRPRPVGQGLGESPVIVGQGPGRPDVRLKTIVWPETGDAPFCNVCGHITMRMGTCYKCQNCGNSMGLSAGERLLETIEPDPITSADIPPKPEKLAKLEPFFLGTGGERIGVEVTPKSITFFAPANKGEPELESQLNLLAAFIAYIKAAGVIMDYSCETTCLNLPAGDRPDRLKIRISHPSDHDNCADFC
ncbi:MAG: hypothetical protein NTY66_00120 [Candidatus Vogelbacteria bacterium]|nr:hypothetical protein [Candidatus Vogelbacteria bacterium]